MAKTSENLPLAWRQYEAGKNYKRSIGLYENVRQNERYYRGEQWHDAAGLYPRPVFNIIRRIIDYLIGSVIPNNISISYSDDRIPFIGGGEAAETIRRGIEMISKNAAYRWDKCRMNQLLRGALLDAAISGDGVFYSYWDGGINTGQHFGGDIVTATVDNINLFVSDVNTPDIQSQDYIILAGRDSAAALRREARAAGAKNADGIIPDEDGGESGELEGEEEAKAGYVIKFWRGADGWVIWEKSARNCVIRRCETRCRLYPVAYFNWHSTKNSFHGTSPVTSLIPNQNFINRAYAMVMKHMTDTAFSKVIYDKTKIPEWSNEVGASIAAIGGGNIADAVSVVGVGKMQDGYLELIENAIATTKELMGATDAALGEAAPNNTSAILALQEASIAPLGYIRDNLHRCVEDIADIWADMMCAYYPPGRLLPYSEDGLKLAEVDFELFRGSMLNAKIDAGAVSRISTATSQSILDKLLDGGYITAEQYLRRMPGYLINDKNGLIEELKNNSQEGETE